MAEDNEQQSPFTRPGFVAAAVVITAASALFVWRSNLSPIWTLLAGGVVGLVVMQG